MTPDQQSALESLAGRALTADELAVLEAPLTIRNDVALADALSACQAPIQRSLAVEEVFDVLYGAGDYATLKAAQLSGDARAVLAFGALADAKTIGPGKVNIAAPVTVALLDSLETEPRLLSAAGRAALVALATAAKPAIAVEAVSRALNVAEGRMTL